VDRGHPTLISHSIKLFILGQTENVILLREFQASSFESCRHVLLLAKTNKREEKWERAKWGEKKVLLFPEAKQLVSQVRPSGAAGEPWSLLP